MSSFFIHFFLWIILACYSTLWTIMCQLWWVFWTFCRLPEFFSEGTRVFVVDPMLATGIYIITWAQTLSGLLDYFLLELRAHFMLVQWLKGSYVTVQISMKKLYCWLMQITREHSYNLMKHILVTKFNCRRCLRIYNRVITCYISQRTTTRRERYRACRIIMYYFKAQWSNTNDIGIINFTNYA